MTPDPPVMRKGSDKPGVAPYVKGKASSMQRIVLVDLYDRGLHDFNSLAPLERDVFVVHDANLYYEMEGCLPDYLSTGNLLAMKAQLQSVLMRIGDDESCRLLAEIQAAIGSSPGLAERLCEQFYARVEERWRLLDLYLAQEGAELV